MKKKSTMKNRLKKANLFIVQIAKKLFYSLINTASTVENLLENSFFDCFTYNINKQIS